MSSSDIYSSRDPIQPISSSQKKRKNRDQEGLNGDLKNGKRKRRSRNSGWRRFVHLYRKERVQKRVWIGVFIFFIFILIVAAFVEFGIERGYVPPEQAQSVLSDE